MDLEVRVERREAIPIAIPMPGGEYRGVLLILHCDGLAGLGEAAALPGRGPSLGELVAELAAEGPPRSAAARFAWETALADLEGRARGLSLATVLGGPRRDRVTCNALIGPGAPAGVPAEMETWLSAGFTTFKLKSTNRGGPVDQERLGAARWAVGQSGRLRLDFNGGLNLATASVVLPSLGRFGLELVEQPLPAASSAEEWAELARCGVRLAADESLADPRLARDLVRVGIGVALKLASVGGARAALELASASTAPVFASSNESSIGLAAALHAACASPAPPLACGLATGRMLDGDLGGGLEWEGAELLLPTGPGLGVELDAAALRRYRLDR